ncbi:bifunctional copper resistance protein CopD/cytochrome c oxidase assembly protein [Umezawaea endophytica]|uniref:Bifunctional copper resistance protein CopD/cytochrome c oxidase assembly protein n=1 Tax=Umezawaea endophytica TaxID=1654476 RepID=A0A9X3ADX5_9PSEU|nr:bifunctional copper resistance protein CopD/cytochrome c oxidase assembly protein [Umezawaea endophytica]MCS7476176.1 bifunctional copper resistance protein CopD/cytochrome c oxidase assembly protein [Umezawaea endophytica]
MSSEALTDVESAPSPRRRRTGLVPLLVVGAGVAALVAAGLLAATGNDRTGLIVVRVLTESAAVVTIGSLLLAAFLVPPQSSGLLAADGYAALRTAGWTALLWTLGAVLAVPFTAADAVGQPVSVMFNPAELLQAAGFIEQARAWMITAVVVALIALGSTIVLSWGWTAVLFFLSLFALLPVAVTGHSSGGGSHDMATNSLLFHLVGAALWVGGLIALLTHGRRRGSDLALATTRFSAIALVCWIVMAVSGVINALVRLPLGDLFTTNYGLLVVAKIAALLLLGGFGYLQRVRGVRDVVRTGSSSALLRLAGIEVLLMFVTLGIAAALSRTPPPTDGRSLPSRVELYIGYDLAGAPTSFRLFFDWRFDLIFGTASIALAVLYLAGVRRLRKRGDAWPVGRTVAWVLGCATILLATSSGIGRYAPAMFSVHMGAHMLLSMLAPILLVLGGPVTLALRALPTSGKDGPTGPRDWILAFVQSPVAKLLTNPFVALFLFVGSFYGLYFSGLFDAALPSHWAHLAMNAHFILVGYVFYWPVIGIDPAPNRLPPLGRLGLLFASIPFHAFFGITLMSSQTVIGENFYRALGLPWVTSRLEDQRLGGGIAWAAGELPLLVVMVALLVQWARSDNRDARRSDRRADGDGDADLAAYNAMLKKMSGD